MKIAVTSHGTQPSERLSHNFGRAPYFLLYDTEATDWTALPNTQNTEAAQGAGIQAAQHISDSGAEILITGSVGPKAFRVLLANRVKMFCSENASVEEALSLWQKGKLTELTEANSPGHVL